MLPGKYYRVCITRAAVNESVYEDSHAENVALASYDHELDI